MISCNSTLCLFFISAKSQRILLSFKSTQLDTIVNNQVFGSSYTNQYLGNQQQKYELHNQTDQKPNRLRNCCCCQLLKTCGRRNIILVSIRKKGKNMIFSWHSLNLLFTFVIALQETVEVRIFCCDLESFFISHEFVFLTQAYIFFQSC